MDITKAEFEARLSKLSEENWKVKSLLKSYGSFDDIPKHLQDKICEALQMKVTTVTTTKYELL